MENKLKYTELTDGVYWVGDTEVDAKLRCNPYLIIDNGESVLIDPGSVLDFEQVFSNVKKLIPLENIKYVILHHQDPDLCASVPLFEKKGLQAKVVTHWRTAVIVKYYGIKSSYYIVNQNEFKLTLSSGRTLVFLPTPYLHFPGSIATYDIQTKTLFSSDLFGAFSNSKWGLFAKEGYIESMKAFHEHYMPGNEILRPVMEKFLTMDILRIAPQHGCIIEEDIKTYIKALRDLECGTFLHPIKKEISKTGGYLGICNQIIKRLYSILEVKEIKRILQSEDIVLDEQTGLIQDFNCTGLELWNKIFEVLYKEKGIDFLTILEPLAQKISREYDILLPEILNSKIVQGEKKAIELSEKNRKLIEVNEELKRNVQEIQDRLTKCPITGLYNEKFFLNYLDITFNKNTNSALLLIAIDNMTDINFNYGSEIGNETIKNLSYLLSNEKEETHQIFKLQGAVFGYCVSDTNKDEAISIAENIRKIVADSETFIENITVSIGLILLDEIKDIVQESEDFSSYIYNIALNRLRTARNKGMNIVCSESSIDDYTINVKKVLIADTDTMSVEILKIFLEKEGFKVYVARDGVEALNIMEKEKISIVISELMLPKLDGLLVKEKMSLYSDKAKIPFILVSYQKDTQTVKRAIELNIDHYFKKPYMLTELIGIVKYKTKRGI
jgi:diguanylate cyclase (GGDEF)-like protein